MGQLRILGASGDTKIEWDVEKEEAVREAERIFRENIARGYAAFKVDNGMDTAQRIDRFDPEAREIIQVPRMIGG